MNYLIIKDNNHTTSTKTLDLLNQQLMI